MKLAGTAMLRTWRNSPKLFSDFNTLSFASVMAVVVFLLLIVFMTATPMITHFVSVDLPRVSQPVSIPRLSDDEDVMEVAITRDGRVYFDGLPVSADMLPERIQVRMTHYAVDWNWRVYIKADGRARWSAVRPVLEGVRTTGFHRVTFLVDQGRPSILAR